MNKLKEILADLKILIEIPRLYLANYFQELRNRIDLLAVERCFNETNEKELNANWTLIIKKIASFEKECFRKMPTNQFSKDVASDALNLVNQIESKMSDFDGMALFDYEKILANETIKLQRILFLNRTIIFLERKDCKMIELFSKMNMNTSFGKLVIVKNKFYTFQELSFIQK